MFKKGQSGNPSGKPKGTKNKLTNTTRQVFQAIVEANHEQIQKDLKALEPKDRVKVLLDMAQYFLPKMQHADISSNVKSEAKARVLISTAIQQQYSNSVQQIEQDQGEYLDFDPWKEEDIEPVPVYSMQAK